MKVFFDQNAPRPLAHYLVKHVVTRSAELGWEELKNGKLLAAAESTGFEVMVTADINIRYQQNLTGRKIALVILPSCRWPAVQDQLQEVVDAVDQADEVRIAIQSARQNLLRCFQVADVMSH